MSEDRPHFKVWCDHCERETTICGRCGNNTCNGGHGVEIGPEPGAVIECRACPGAYEFDAKA